jgi:hypothetical protein
MVSVKSVWAVVCRRVLVRIAFVLFLILPALAENGRAASSPPERRLGNADIDSCASGALTPMTMVPLAPKDLEVTGLCTVPAGSYYYRNVNIFKKNNAMTGGILSFQDATIDFWANSILVENAGTLRAGVADDGSIKPIGTANILNKLTIHLWGKESDDPKSGSGITCKTNPGGADGNECGVDQTDWKSNIGNTDPKTCTLAKSMPGGVKDCFYAYRPLNWDGAIKTAYFGYKVLAVSWGGSLQLFGLKGASYDAKTNGDASSSGVSWARLAANLTGSGSEKQITLDRKVNWQDGDPR